MSAFDLLAVALFAAATAALGLAVARGPRGGGREWLVAGGALPAWAVWLSLSATELSAATFLGVPEAAFRGNWFFLELAFGALAGKIVVATWVLPRYHRAGVVTVYGYLERGFGPRTRRAAALAFLLGRALASGARLFIAALALAVVLAVPLPAAIVAAGLLALLYTRGGGIRSVIWTDVLQALVLFVGAFALLAVAVRTTGLSLSDLWLWAGDEGRRQVIHLDPWWSWTSSKPFGSAFAGGLFLTLATHSCDHDMVQRLFATGPVASARALIGSALLNFPLTALFLLIGTALARVALDTPGAVSVNAGGRDIVAVFALESMPSGLRGLVFAALAAAALSSLDSALCAMASTWVVDLEGGDPDDPTCQARLRRVSVACVALLIGAALAVAAYDQRASALAINGGFSLVELALAAMTVVYGGLLALFAWALAGRRAPDASGPVALGVAAAVGLALFLQPFWLGEIAIAWVFWIPCSAACALVALALARVRQGRISSR